MTTTPRIKQIAALVADHVRADPATRWLIHFHSANPADWSIWLLRPGMPLFTYDNLYALHT